MEWDVRHVAETESTNADAAAAARDGAPEGTVIVADHQTAGRGRLDRTWEAPAGSGLVMSALMRPDGLDPALWPWIPLTAGVATGEAVATLGLVAQLKWPNDVEINGRKLAGILVERIETPDGPAAVVGIGLNVAMSEDQLPIPTATSLILQGIEVEHDTVLTAVLEALGRCYETLLVDAGAVRAAYLAACSTVGSRVQVALPDGSTLDGDATDVDEHGRLVVDGRPVTAGDVVHVRS
jgi:BirA family transcriptional regulator, biotin operon repressor / biotin---[acetyl-CoA-carboxylase] ligase